MLKGKRGNSRLGFNPIKIFTKPKRSGSRGGFNKYNIFTKPPRSQHTLGLPFGVIFSIILIVVFIVVAFIAIRNFLDIGECAKVGQFYEDFQNKINEVWASQSSSIEYAIDGAPGIKKICFANLSSKITGSDYEEIKNYEVYEANLFLLPPEKTCNMPYKLIKHINISAITAESNPYCVDAKENLRIKKDFYDKFVIVE